MKQNSNFDPRTSDGWISFLFKHGNGSDLSDLLGLKTYFVSEDKFENITEKQILTILAAKCVINIFILCCAVF